MAKSPEFDKDRLRGLSKDQRREYLREQARLQREAETRRRKRNRLVVQLSVVVGVVAVLAVVGWFVFASLTATTAMPRNMASNGILLTGGNGTVSAVTTPALEEDEEPIPTDQSEYPDVLNITTYVDYLCPYCGQFETTNGDQIRELVEAGAATLEVHPLAILDSQSVGTRYSTRAANAATCVADLAPDSFLDVNEALFANQPEEGTTGLTDDELIELVRGAGVDDSEVNSCIRDKTFSGWVNRATSSALGSPVPNSDLAGVTGTPTVIVNGVQYTGPLDDPDAFVAFLAAQAGGGANSSTAPAED